MDQLLSYWPQLLDGTLVTIRVAVLSILGAAVVALLLGLLRSTPKKPVKRAAGAFVELIRGATVIIYLFWVYYALPAIPGGPQLDPTAASVLIISLVAGAYGAEGVRAGIASVPTAQLDAAHALGLSARTKIFRVVLPQALTQAVPAFGSIAIDTVKWTSITSFVGVPDLLYQANTIRVNTDQTVLTYVVVALIYLVLCYAASVVFRLIESALPANRAQQTRPSRELVRLEVPA